MKEHGKGASLQEVTDRDAGLTWGKEGNLHGCLLAACSSTESSPRPLGEAWSHHQRRPISPRNGPASVSCLTQPWKAWPQYQPVMDAKAQKLGLLRTAGGTRSFSRPSGCPQNTPADPQVETLPGPRLQLLSSFSRHLSLDEPLLSSCVYTSLQTQGEFSHPVQRHWKDSSVEKQDLHCQKQTFSKPAVLIDLSEVSHWSCLQARKFGSGVRLFHVPTEVTVPFAECGSRAR